MESTEKKNFYNDKNYISFVVAYDGNIKKEIDDINDASIFFIDDNFAILSIKLQNYMETIRSIKSIIYIELNGIYTLSESPVEDSKAPIFHRNPSLNLRGSGVVVAIVDTGIDYLNNEFMREDETTRILRIWDQTIDSGKTPDGFISGSEYTEEDINKAIQAQKQGQNPYDIVPSKDDYGHGTKMAGIVGARGINREIVGVAPDCEFIIIKLQEASKEYIDFYYAKGDKAKYRNKDIIMALKYLYELSFTLNKPMIIYLPLGSNLGDHAGASILERYVDTKISGRNSLFVVTSTGNQGNTDTHTSGEIKSNGDSQIIELNCGKEQQGLVLQIYAQRPSKIKLGILSPSGERFENTNPRKTKHILINDAPTWKFIYEGTTVQVTYDSPDEFTGDDKFVIKMEGITEGVWRFILTGNNIVDGKYYAWILQRELLAEDTRFLNPSPYTTLTIPGTAKTIINTSYYNQNNGAIVSESGRGYTMKDYIQPIITAGGINAITTKPGGGTITMSGASVAGAILAGCCALIIQWAVVDGNDPQMYATKLQAYIIRGARKREGDTYPNRQWGYGILDMQEIFKSLTNK
ncbi:S8 family peptidase [Clostridium perfringens]|uniref:S8 family serine peptidase n=1 Tax=Clostridium perfringens TaxID=1502 RepID=A0AAW9HY62_CLOPF|nr:S8 family peptidase [Clostridium perfringens]MBI5977597.1 S8 family peptidase [Clostridium perfringens]MBI5980428.1 S8 family peptidase [Clostridium perfringens]MBI5987526.1 S8 family peptidase [Clostridium perfringens]MBI5999240.1 S8 family peptidase [Clostridium perfringens]MBI6003900.1 S8 family peptidase [Clostridium perfringens]